MKRKLFQQFFKLQLQSLYFLTSLFLFGRNTVEEEEEENEYNKDHLTVSGSFHLVLLLFRSSSFSHNARIRKIDLNIRAPSRSSFLPPLSLSLVTVLLFRFEEMMSE